MQVRVCTELLAANCTALAFDTKYLGGFVRQFLHGVYTIIIVICG